MKLCRTLVLGGMLLASAAAVAGPTRDGRSHGHSTFSAGEPGDARRPSRVVNVVMREGDGRMLYVPDRLEVKKSEQVRFVLRNNGELAHEFVLATAAENLEHAEEMKKAPDMEHDDPNARRLDSKKSGDLVWKFTTTGEFEFGCLIPGHREAGMIGTIIVK